MTSGVNWGIIMGRNARAEFGRIFGEMIFAARVDQKLSQQQVTDIAGVQRITVSRYEAVKIKPNMYDAICIAGALGIGTQEVVDMVDGGRFGTKPSKKQKAVLKAVDALDRANSLMTEAQVATMVISKAVKALRKAKSEIIDILETLGHTHEDVRALDDASSQEPTATEPPIV